MNIQYLTQKVINLLGYEISKKAKGSMYTPCPPYGYSTYSPWFTDWFQRKYKEIEPNTLVKEDRCYILHQLTTYGLNLEGDFVECGVFKGGTAYLIADVIKNFTTKPKIFHLFDTFKGMPELANQDSSSHKKGDFGDISLDKVKHLLKPFSFIQYHAGVIPNTFSQTNLNKIAFAHIDVDLYQTVLDCCSFFYNKLSKGGIMIFDDYGFYGYKDAAKKAVDEFFNDKPEPIISLRNGQSFIIKV